MARAPAAELAIICGTQCGETPRCPFSRRMMCSDSIVESPPMPVPITEPISVRS